MGPTQADLARAILIAAQAHSDQLDKAGRPYILHPIRVMQRVHQHGPAAEIVAVLHDVVEDTPVTLEELADQGFGPDIIAGVDALTRRDGEDYFDYIERCSQDQIGCLVKLADLEDNSDPIRSFPGQRIGRYSAAREIIARALDLREASAR
jgi:(p)ppGpp synthase/HD superfamily hydrolase